MGRTHFEDAASGNDFAARLGLKLSLSQSEAL